MIGKIIANKYRVTAQLGAGGMSRVYRAAHLILERECAIKVLHVQLNSDPSFVERFLREARAASQLDHDNIIPIYEVLEETGQHYIVMELFNGISLKTLLEKNRPLSLATVVSIIAQCARGLAYAHAQGIVHRDIRPSNIMINAKARIKMTDFGIAAAMDDSASSTISGQWVSTPRYMSPEQAKNEPLDRRSDIYSLGLVFYQLVTGIMPFAGNSSPAIIGRQAYDFDELALVFPDHVPKDLRELIKKMVSRLPDSRFSHVTHLMQRLNGLSLEADAVADNAVVDKRVNQTTTKPLDLAPVAADPVDPAGISASLKVQPAENAPKPLNLEPVATDQVEPVGMSKSLMVQPVEHAPAVMKRTKRYKTPVAASVFLVFGLGLTALYFYNHNGNSWALNSNAGATFILDSAEYAAKAQQALEVLLQKQAQTQVTKTLAQNVQAERYAGDKFGQGQDKELIASESIVAINQHIRNQHYDSAERAIDTAGVLFDGATEFYQAAKAEAQPKFEKTMFVDIERVRLEVEGLDNRFKDLQAPITVRKNQERAKMLLQQAGSQYAKARERLATAPLDTVFSLVEAAQRNYADAKVLYQSLAVYAEGEDNVGQVVALHSKLRTLQLDILAAIDMAERHQAPLNTKHAYQAVTELNSQLSSEALLIDRLLKEKRYSQAGSQLRKSLDLAKRVLSNYHSVSLAAQQVHSNTLLAETSAISKEKPLQGLRPSQKDAVAVESLLSDFKQAFEARDLAQLQKIAELSEPRLNATREVFERFEEVHLSVTSYALSQTGATAEISVDRVVSANGDDVPPNAQWKNGNLELIYNQNGWEKIRWH